MQTGLSTVQTADNSENLLIISSLTANWLVDLILYILVNSYGHVGTVSSPNHTFFLGKLD